ncbi:arsenate reductase family protein [Lewinella cohaerens]|uniref:arsenate reductase family protein n=1 Tax=Lewinella cohaerens TaxID=70995 RepID=UPI0004774388|nr:ArsC/Spx/MgsR family protein [Lewinella cohaerens]
MPKIYHLSTCTTCKKVIAALNNGEGFELQDIKTNNVTAEQLDALKEVVGSYEGLFSRRAMKYRSMGLGDKELSEADYRQLILDEYTFLKRPVVVIGDQVFTGSSKKSVEGALAALKA